MIDLNSLQKKFSTTEKKVKIEAWDGEVKLKRLTLEETARYISIQKEDGHIAGMIDAVVSALIEPKVTVEDLNELNEEAFTGVQEIFIALNEFSAPKK